MEQLTINEIKYIAKRCAEELIKEAYGISELVSSEASSFIDVINNRIDNGECIVRSYSVGDGGQVRRIIMEFNYLFFTEYSLQVSLDVNVSEDIETLNLYKNRYKIGDDISFSPTEGSLTFKMVALTKDIENFRLRKFGGDFEGLLEHELKHAYQTYMKYGAYAKAPYNGKKTENLVYLNRVERRRLKNDGDYGIYWDINNCIYYSLKIEHTAFQQEITRNILNHVKTKKDIYEYIKSYDYYHVFEQLKKLKQEISGDEKEVDEYLKNVYGKTLKWFYKVLDYTIKNMRHTINRAVWYAMGMFGKDIKENKTYVI